MRILAVDDDPNDLRYIHDTLASSGYEPVMTGDPEEAVRLMKEAMPDLVLLDLMLPETDGIDLMGDILEVTDVPVIFLSAYGREEVVARAFEMGAVDYVVKPFSSTELSARIKAALRKRVTVEPSEPYVLGDLTIDYGQRRVTLASRRVRLTPTEYGMLAELSAHAGRVLTHEHLLERVWRERGDGSVRPMHTMVSKLRRKLGDDAGRPHLHLHRAPRRLPYAQGGGGCGGGGELRVRHMPIRILVSFLVALVALEFHSSQRTWGLTEELLWLVSFLAQGIARKRDKHLHAF